MRETCTSGSVGALGRQRPGATRLPERDCRFLLQTPGAAKTHEVDAVVRGGAVAVGADQARRVVAEAAAPSDPGSPTGCCEVRTFRARSIYRVPVQVPRHNLPR